MNNIAYLLALQSIHGLGPIRLKAVIDYFEDPKLAWEAKPEELVRLGVPTKIAWQVKETRQKLDPEKYINYIQKLGIDWLTIYDDTYPTLLKEIYDPPIVLFGKGNIECLNNKAVAIVGTRKITGYGKLVTEKFSQYLAESGLIIVSGLARGVDTIAHRACLEAKGKTVAVLGGGLKNIFPPENSRLAEEIINQGGAVISEFAPDDPSLPGNFPARNRIISGLSIAVLVTEAAEDSGSLITVKCALDQGREVMAVPGPITSDYSKGPLLMIKQGAKLVTEPAEVLEELGFEKRIMNNELRSKGEEKLSDAEKIILELLEGDGKHVDEICRELKINSAEVSAALVKMEIYGFVKNLGGGNYIKLI